MVLQPATVGMSVNKNRLIAPSSNEPLKRVAPVASCELNMIFFSFSQCTFNFEHHLLFFKLEGVSNGYLFLLVEKNFYLVVLFRDKQYGIEPLYRRILEVSYRDIVALF